MNTCTCKIADSFNVRVSDLVDHDCPIHGCRFKKVEISTVYATHDELMKLVRQHLFQMELAPGHYVFVIKNADISAVVTNLLSQYEIRRKP
jgi:hypothetical protein